MLAFNLMDLIWNSKVIDLKNLLDISRGNEKVVEKYLRQFQSLIPERVKKLKNSLKSDERKMVRQIVHQMSPQLQFFGIPNVLIPVRRLELEYETMTPTEIGTLVENLITKLNAACSEVDHIIQSNFEN